MAGLLDELRQGVKALGAEWTKYSVVGSFVLYVFGYLALRFHLMALGISTDLAVLDERYLFTGARFLVYVVSLISSILLIALPVAAVAIALRKRLQKRPFASITEWIAQPARLTAIGIVFAVAMIQLVMKQCFALSNLLLSNTLPNPAWLANLLLDERWMPLYFSALVAACAVPIAILVVLGRAPTAQPGAWTTLARGLLIFLAAVQILLLPINYGVLVVDNMLPRVSSTGEQALSQGDEAWLVWEGKEGVTFLVWNRERRRRALLTLSRADVKRTEIVGYDAIVSTVLRNR